MSSDNEGNDVVANKEIQTPSHAAGSFSAEDGESSVTPFKSPYHNILPPLPKGSTIMPKRRKLSNDKLATPTKIENAFVPLIPHKSRNLSTPAPKRIPSITEAPIPDLTPPASSAINRSFNSTFDSPASPSTITSSPLKIQTPILGDLSGIQLSREESKVDQETRNLLRQIEKLKQYKSIRDQKKTDEVDQLILKWRDASQKSSAYLYNDAKIKINKMGGWKVFKRHQREKEKQFVDDEILDKLYEFKESEDFSQLDQYEQDEFEAKIKAEEAKLNALNSDGIDVEFDNANDELKEVLKLFGVDSEKFKLIYGDD